MDEDADIHCYTAWVNVHLATADCQLADVIRELLQGLRLRALLQSVTGSTPKRLDSLDGLTVSQKVMRVDWFVDALKASKKLPQSFKVDSKMISLQSADHLLPVLCRLINNDIFYLYERATPFMKRDHLQGILAEPLQCGPCKIRSDATQAKSFYTTSRGRSLAQHLHRRCPEDMSALQCALSIINKLLKTTTDGRGLHIRGEWDLIDSRVLCALTNALIPGTFPTEVLVNDRWTINLVLETFAKIVCVQSHIDSGDLHRVTKESCTAFLGYVLMSGLQYSQAAAVARRMDVLQNKQEEIRRDQSAAEGDHNQDIQSRLDKLCEEMDWIQETYHHERCKEWTEHAKTIQAQVKVEVNTMIQSRFSQVTVPRPMTINRLTESLLINLSLTGGSGFYLTDSKETLWPSRRLVVQNKKTGEYYEDFSGYDNHKGAVREMLGLHSCDIVEVNPTQHLDYLLFFESTSRNKILKANTKFLYQVFPGTSSQCRRQLLRATRAGELDTVKKLLAFFKSDATFVNGRNTETGNTALHIASRHGHMEVMVVLLDSGARVNALNNAGSTPFFLATEGLHKTPSLLLLEWGADIHIKNKVSKTALELTRNADLKAFLTRKYVEYQELQTAGSNLQALERHIDKHISSSDTMASLTSRCIKGSTLLHVAASTGCLGAVKKLLSQHVRADILNAQRATPLHVTRDPVILELMLECDVDVNSVDDRGNTPLHCVCREDKVSTSLPDCVSLLVSHGASLSLQNNDGHLPIHCAASQGLTSVIECLLSCGTDAGLPQDELHRLLEESVLPSLPYLALTGNHLQCSQWLTQQGFLFKTEELDGMLIKLLMPQQQSRCSQYEESVAFVIEQGADTNFIGKSGNRPLHLAAQLTEHPDIVEVLLEKGADPNSINSSGATPLIAACQSDNIFSAGMLLRRGASVDVRDAVGMCAFDYIRDYEEWIHSGHFTPDVVNRLRDFKLRHGKELVNSVSRLLNTTRHLKASF